MEKLARGKTNLHRKPIIAASIKTENLRKKIYGTKRNLARILENTALHHSEKLGQWWQHGGRPGIPEIRVRILESD